MKPKDLVLLAVVAVLIWLMPRLSLFYIVCGLLDFRRSKRFEAANWRRYFFGNGILTWFLSPFNLLTDLLCARNCGIYQLTDLPDECQKEIRLLMSLADNEPKIISELGKRMTEKKRGMIFFKWYGKNITNTLTIPEFHQPFKYIKTIGVSIFNKNQSTSTHYGPLRITLRVLYNLVPLKNDGIYIAAANQRHLWHDNPLFIFDDTLVHQSVNGSDQLRYCMFVDILRPSRQLSLMGFFLSIVRSLIISFNRIFYKNWDMIK